MKFWRQIYLEAENIFENSFRMCVNCGHRAKPDHILCGHCTRILQRNRRGEWVEGYCHKTLSLYRWSTQDEYFIRLAIHRLKGGGARRVYGRFAEELLSLRMGHKNERTKGGFNPINWGAESTGWIFVPAPGRNSWGRDHAESLAFELAKLSGGRYLPALIRAESVTEQKRKTRKQRLRDIKNGGLKQGVDLPACGRVIFVDDVITSGATAQRAFEDLGRPENFEVWTLFHRPRVTLTDSHPNKDQSKRIWVAPL